MSDDTVDGHVVLGYGALLDHEHVRRLCGADHVHSIGKGRLDGFRRHWNVLYRNGSHPTGAYARPDGASHDGGIAFLSLYEAANAELVVTELLVDDAGLARIDDEEYLYHRFDVADRYQSDGPKRAGAVWLYEYVPGDFPDGVYEGDEVVAVRHYVDLVRAASDLLDGEGSFDRTTDPLGYPIIDLAWRDERSGETPPKRGIPR